MEPYKPKDKYKTHRPDVKPGTRFPIDPNIYNYPFDDSESTYDVCRYRLENLVTGETEYIEFKYVAMFDQNRLFDRFEFVISNRYLDGNPDIDSFAMKEYKEMIEALIDMDPEIRGPILEQAKAIDPTEYNRMMTYIKRLGG